MASGRETVKRAIEFDDPAWTPYQVSISTRNLRRYRAPGEVDELESALLEAGAIETDGTYAAQKNLIILPPTPVLPEPYRPLVEDEWVDEWGVIWTSPEFPRVFGHPLEHGWELLDDYRLPDPCAPGRYAEAERLIAQHADRYRLGWVWFTLFERLWFLRGFDNMLMDPYIHPQEFARLADQVIGFNLDSIQQQLALGVDGIFFSDDWGTQRGLLMNPDDWRRFYKPLYQRMFDAVHAGGARVWMHLCGNVTTIVPDLIEVGLDVLNPVQPQAMDVDLLADQFGGHLCFFGGADVQGTLPQGTPLDVKEEVRHLVDIFGSYSGGYIGGTSHTILPDTPSENVIALFRAFAEYSGAA